MLIASRALCQPSAAAAVYCSLLHTRLISHLEQRSSVSDPGPLLQPASSPRPSESKPDPSKVLGILDRLQERLQERRESSLGASSSRSAVGAASTGARPSASQGAFSLQQQMALQPQPMDVKLESYMIFQRCWQRFLERHSGTNFVVPREIIWLNGAPGSGKGANTPHIMHTRGLSHSICMSSLLASQSESKKFIEAGEMISDAVVCDVLLEAILCSGAGGGHGLLVDGFPRTATQVDILKLLHDRLLELHDRYADTAYAPNFPRPSFKVVVLYVDEETSKARQAQRAAAASLHNQRVRDAGGSDEHQVELRSTDVSLDKCSKRYQIFRHHYPAILRLKQFFPFHLIDAMGSVADTQEQIAQELRYQSSLDLSEATYSAIRHLPLARELQRSARQHLVCRLEGYCERRTAVFMDVVGLLEREVVPLLRQGGLSGCAEWATQHPLFADNPDAADMVLDVLSDRGFQAHYVREQQVVPIRFDLATGEITSEQRPLHRFVMRFESPGVRDGSTLKAMEIAARVAEATRSASAAAAAAAANGAAGSDAGAVRHAPVTMSFIPEHLDLENKLQRGDRAMSGQPQQQAAVVAMAAAGEAQPISMRLSSIRRCSHPDASCSHVLNTPILEAVSGSS